MRVWLDPEGRAARPDRPRRGAAIREQNVQVAAGVVGAPPTPPARPAAVVNAQGRLKTEAEFARHHPQDRRRRRHHAPGRRGAHRAGAADYGPALAARQQAGGGHPIFQRRAPTPGHLDRVRATMAELQKDFPKAWNTSIVYDPTQFVRASIKAVITTLLEAIALVVLVVILFLQTWRASIIPLLAVPVSIIGTFAVMLGFGFSINALSLFGLVLAIGIVVDDAIVVVENVERNIAAGLSPRDATYRAMHEVSGPIIAIALVLVAVFVPLAFIRPHRPVLQAVRADHRHLHGDLGLQLADPVAGAGRPAAQGPRRAQGRLTRVHGPLCSAASSRASTASSRAARALRRAACQRRHRARPR
jgi:multidrug efflux pump